MPTEEEMQAMLHYHLMIVHEAAAVSVTEFIEVDRHRYCVEVIRAELADAFAILGYTFEGETVKDGRSEILFTFDREPSISAGFAIFDCACHDGEMQIIARVAQMN